jgi:hypothetical protein
VRSKNEKWQPQWVALPIIDFVRIVHEFGDDGDAALRWLHRFANDLLFANFSTDDEFAKELLMDAREKYIRRSNAGKMGGRPPRSTPDASEGRGLPKPEQVYDFARENGLDEMDARDWYEMTIVDRGGKTRNGDPIVNWKGACKRFCTARAKARNKNGENQ